MRTKSLLFIAFVSMLIWACSNEPIEERFYDVIGQISYNNVDVSINHGTFEITNDRIISNVQTPNIELEIKSNNTDSVLLNFEFRNMRTDQLPEIVPNTGRVSRGDKAKYVNYRVLVPPMEARTIHLNSFTETRAYKFGVVGDIQSSWEFGEKIAESIDENEIDFFVHVGDIVMFGTEEAYQEAIELMEKFPVPVYLLLGNHDGSTGYDSGYKYFRQYFGKTNYSFSYNNDLFLMLDAANQGMSADVFDYSRKTLELNKDENKFVFLHVPPFDESGIRSFSFSTSIDAARFMNLMIDNDVDLIFSGHIHTYQDYTISGVRTIVAGIGGGVPEGSEGVSNGYVIVTRNESGISTQRIDLKTE